jgi:hypothetical protein
MSVVDVWLLPVRHGAATDPSAVAVLDGRERDKITALGVEDDRDRAVTARIAARTELARRLHVSAEAVPLTTDADDCPYVRGWAGGISWAHSGDWVALAVSNDRLVGIDIEKDAEAVPPKALETDGVSSIEEVVDLEAAGKATCCIYGGHWPPGIRVDRLPAPDGYHASLAAAGHEWTISLHEELATSASAAAHSGG